MRQELVQSDRGRTDSAMLWLKQNLTRRLKPLVDDELV